jgi:hypothetical protein
MTQLFSVTNHTLVKLDPDSSSESAGLQAWIAEHPELLGGEEMDPNDPRRFLLIKREVHNESGFLDHLFLDQDAVPTMVEAKLSASSESRRKVVGQLLDYASEAGASWTGQMVAGWFGERCAKEGLEPSSELEAFEPVTGDPDSFWRQAEENLRAGNVRLVFACDDVPSSLQRIVEYLNERMDPTEVLALQVQCMRAGNQEIYSSTLVGATERARAVKGKPRQPSVILSLVEKGLLKDGQKLWLLRDFLPSGVRPDSDDDPALGMRLKLDGARPMIAYAPPGQAEEEIWPSQVYGAVRKLFDPSYEEDRLSAVHDRFSTDPGGQPLGELAVESGAWSAT